MKGLKNLIRLHEWTVDERRRELANELKALEMLDGQRAALEAELENEQRLVSADPENLGHAFGGYYHTYRERRSALEEMRSTKEREILIARDNLGAAYQDLKKYEIAQEVRETEARKEADHKEQESLDEMALNQFRRRKILENQE